jgi:hypothetical protein
MIFERGPFIGVDEPSQSGQWLPQPSPDLEARTKTPQATVARL